MSQKLLYPVVIQKNVDCETPVSIYQKIRESGLPSFLLESVEGQEKWARYSFIGFQPLATFQSRGPQITLTVLGKEKKKKLSDPFSEWEKFFRSFQIADFQGEAGRPRFFGGAVGYLSYEMVHHFEKIRGHKLKDDLAVPDCFFMIPEILLVFDNVRHRLELIGFARKGGENKVLERLKEISRKIDSPPLTPALPPGLRQGRPKGEGASSPFGGRIEERGRLSQNWSPAAFKKAVSRVKNYIVAGDVTQTVLSLRQSAGFSGDPFLIYRSLRRENPSPYLFYLEAAGQVLLGASPETMVRLEGNQLVLRPIAGTRARHPDPLKDRALEEELLADPKERAEHVMLVDLGRNDLGRVARTGSVVVDQLMTVERYSHVRHLVSNVRAELAEGKNAFDLIRATFPAGTLTGSPKIRAMEIIRELEPTCRGAYGGCVGYFDFAGNMDMAITIRSALIRDGKIHIQSGAGIVADSDPEREYEECLNKAKGVLHALDDR